MVGTKWELNI